MPFNAFGPQADLQTVIRERGNDVATVAQLEQQKRNGRVRTGQRAVPANASDVLRGDAVGDVLTDATYIYELITVSGSLKWDRRSHSVGW